MDQERLRRATVYLKVALTMIGALVLVVLAVERGDGALWLVVGGLIGVAVALFTIVRRRS